MAYTITITEKRATTKIVGKVWDKVGQEQKDSIREGTFYLSDVYGYTPEIEKQVEEEREVLKQCVDTLDLPAVIKAVNGL